MYNVPISLLHELDEQEQNSQYSSRLILPLLSVLVDKLREEQTSDNRLDSQFPQINLE